MEQGYDWKLEVVLGTWCLEQFDSWITLAVLSFILSFDIFQSICNFNTLELKHLCTIEPVNFKVFMLYDSG